MYWHHDLPKEKKSLHPKRESAVKFAEFYTKPNSAALDNIVKIYYQ